MVRAIGIRDAVAGVHDEIVANMKVMAMKVFNSGAVDCVGLGLTLVSIVSISSSIAAISAANGLSSDDSVELKKNIEELIHKAIKEKHFKTQ